MKTARLLVLFVLLACPAMAQTIAPLDTPARQAFLLDVNTGTPLFAKDADAPMPTSSMSKMLTIYLVFDALKSGKLTMETMLPTSEHAWKQEGSRMFLNVGQQARVEDLIRGVVIQSGNDASVVFAEYLGASEQNFSEMMNAKAQQLGMAHSHFTNATGMPDPQHYSTARDLATLAQALLRDFPEHYHFFSEKTFTYNNIEQGNRNPLLYRAMQVDGLKTGHTEVGGYGLTASALRDGRRLVMVLNGLKDMQARADESAKVLDWGYREFGLYPVAKAGEKIATTQVDLGKAPAVDLVVARDVAVTLPRSVGANLKKNLAFDPLIPAPITKGQQLGTLTLTAPGMDTQTIPLLAATDIPRLGFFARIWVKMQRMMHRKEG